jgi:hypothetical protein
MSKRFIDTKLFKKKFFRGLKGPYKLFWIYVFLDCDHAGIWIVDFDMVNFCIKGINKTKAFELFQDKVVVFDNGEKWFLPSFIDFQYGELNPSNRVHNSVINILKKEKLYEENKGLIRPLKGLKDKDKDMDKEKDMDKDKNKDIINCNICLTEYMLIRIQENKQLTITESKINKWVNTFRIIREQDKREVNVIFQMIKECYDMKPDCKGFTWAKYILSPDKLRKQWNDGKIYIGMNNGYKQTNLFNQKLDTAEIHKHNMSLLEKLK